MNNNVNRPGLSKGAKSPSMKLARTLVLLICLALALQIAALGADSAIIDSTKTGSISIEKYAGSNTSTPLAGVTFSAYRIAYYDEGTGRMRPVSEFSTLIPLDENGDVDTESLSSNLSAIQAFIRSNNIGADYVAAATDRDGYTRFSNLPLGIYVILETAAPANVVARTANFFVSVPMTNAAGDGWVYDIEALPKNEVRTPTTTTTEIITRNPSTNPPTRVTSTTTTASTNITTTPGDNTNIGDTDTPLATIPGLTDIVDVDTPLSDVFDLPKTGGDLAIELLTLGGPILMLLGFLSIMLLGSKRRKYLAEGGTV